MQKLFKKPNISNTLEAYCVYVTCGCQTVTQCPQTITGCNPMAGTYTTTTTYPTVTVDTNPKPGGTWADNLK